MLACQVGRLPVVEYLMSTGKVNVNAVDHNGCTALHHSCWEGHPKIVNYLISVGADEHAVNKKKCRPLDVCKTPQMREQVLHIIKAHAVNDTDLVLPDTAPDVSTDFTVTESTKAYRDSIESFREFVAHYGTAPEGEPDTMLRAESTFTNGDLSFTTELTSEIMNEALESPKNKAATPPARRLSAKGYAVSLESFDRGPSPPPSESVVSGRKDGKGSKRGISDVLEKATEEYALTHPHELLPKSESSNSAAVMLATKLLTPESASKKDTRSASPGSGASASTQGEGEIANGGTTPAAPDRSTSLPLPATTDKPIVSQRDLLKQISNAFPAEGVVKLVWRICKQLGDVLAIINLVLKHPEALHPDLRDERGLTPLQCAILSGFGEIVEFMVEKKLYLQCTDPLGDTPLHKACVTGSVDIARTIIDKFESVNVNAKNNEGSTALHIAVAGNFFDLVKYLVLTARASLEAKDKRGRSPVDVAVEIESQELVDFLETAQLDELDNMADGDIALTGDGPMSPGMGHAVSAQRALMIGSPKVTRKSSKEERERSNSSSSIVDTTLLSPEEMWSAKIEEKIKHTKVPNTPLETEPVSLEVETVPPVLESPAVDLATSPEVEEENKQTESPSTPLETEPVSFEVETVPPVLESPAVDPATSSEPLLFTPAPTTPKKSSISMLFGSVQSMMDEMEKELDDELSAGADVDTTAGAVAGLPLSITEVCNGVVFEEDLGYDDADDDAESVHDENMDLSIHQHKLVSLLGYSNSASMDEGDFSGEAEIRMSGSTPPPDCMADDEKEEWMYLSRALLQARQMEEETEEAIQTQQKSRVLDTASVMAVDIRWLYLMGAACRVLGSSGYKALARRFYQWKYADVGGPSAVGLYSAFYNRTPDDEASLSRNELHDSKQRGALAARMTPALVFALHVLGRHARTCQRNIRREACAKAWALWASLVSEAPVLTAASSIDLHDDEHVHQAACVDDLGAAFDMERTMDSSMAGSIFPGLKGYDEECAREHEGAGAGEEALDASALEVDGEEDQGDGAAVEEEEEEEGSVGEEKGQEGELEELEDLTVLGALPNELNVLLKPNEVYLVVVMTMTMH
jgi:ankyrin repeat protein